MKQALALCALALACSAPALQPELADAEAHARAGRNDEALLAYGEAQRRCGNIGNLRRRYATCREAFLGQAELLDRIGRRRQAAEAYEQVPKALPDHDNANAEAHYRAGRIFLELGDDTRGYTNLWKTVTDYPDEEFAADALKIVVRDGRRRNAKQLHTELTKLARAFPGRSIGDNLLYHLADLSEKELEDMELALSYYDLLVQQYGKGPLADDALWHGARLARKRGDARGAVRRLRDLQSRREVSFGTGSYLSVWHDDGLFLLALVLRDDLKEHEKAVKELRKLPRLYPSSTLKDDALMEEARALVLMEKSKAACAVLAKLRKRHSESRYELKDAPALRRELGCSPP